MMPNEVQALIAKVIFFMISFTMLSIVKARAADLPQGHILDLNKGKAKVVRILE